MAKNRSITLHVLEPGKRFTKEFDVDKIVALQEIPFFAAVMYDNGERLWNEDQDGISVGTHPFVVTESIHEIKKRMLQVNPKLEFEYRREQKDYLVVNFMEHDPVAMLFETICLN